MVYLMAMPGGGVADRLLGTRRSVLWGGTVIAAGLYVPALPVKPTLFVGLGLIVLGTGLLKPNIYMGINLGAFIAPLITGYYQEQNRYHLAFGIAAVGMTLAVIQYVLGSKRLEGVGLKAHKPLVQGEARLLLKFAALASVHWG
jgi:POT family proton-dependent oligopeptide transporter